MFPGAGIYSLQLPAYLPVYAPEQPGGNNSARKVIKPYFGIFVQYNLIY